MKYFPCSLRDFHIWSIGLLFLFFNKMFSVFFSILFFFVSSYSTFYFANKLQSFNLFPYLYHYKLSTQWIIASICLSNERSEKKRCMIHKIFNGHTRIKFLYWEVVNKNEKDHYYDRQNLPSSSLKLKC